MGMKSLARAEIDALIGALGEDIQRRRKLAPETEKVVGETREDYDNLDTYHASNAKAVTMAQDLQDRIRDANHIIIVDCEL